MTTVLVLPENIFNIEVYSRSTWFHFELNLSKFSGFLWKNPCKKKKVCINYFDEQEKPWIFFKIFQKKKQNSKAICALLDYSKPKIFFVWNSTKFKFVKKTSIPKSVRSLGYIKSYSPSRPRPVNIPSNSIKYNRKKICCWSRRTKTILEIRKKSHISLGDQQFYDLQVFQRLY